MAKLLLSMKTKKKNLVRELNPLTRVYTMTRATLFCFGSIIGVHFYLKMANSAMFYGPLATPWYIIGGFLALMIGKCYGELASLAPCAGAAYDYSYHTMGEIIGFFTGWIMVLSLSIKFIFSVRALSNFVDQNFFNGTIKSSSDRTLKMYNFSDTSIFENAPDLSAIPFCLLLGGLYSTFSTESAVTNSIINITNMIIMAIILIILLLFANIHELYSGVKFNKTTEFFSKGFSIAQYSYAGQELAVYLGEEAIDPHVTIPKCILSATSIAIFCYSTFTFIYSLLPKQVNIRSKGSIIEILRLLQLENNIGWLIGLGAICSMLASSYANMFSLTRLLYSMSKDGMVFSFFSLVQETTKTLVASTFTLVTLLGVLGIFVKIKFLFILATYYTSLEHLIISICVLLTRYRCEEHPKLPDPGGRWLLFNSPKKAIVPTWTTERISILLIINCGISIYATSICFMLLYKGGSMISKIGFLSFLCLSVLFGILLGRQPHNNRRHLAYSIRAIPYVPLFVMGYSIFMIAPHSNVPSIFTICWLGIGFIFYLAYSSRHSTEFGHTFPLDPDARWSCMLENEPITVTPSTSPSEISQVGTKSDDSLFS